MAEWARVVNTTTREYLRGEEVNVLRNRKLTALLQQKGRIMFNESGEQVDWKVRYRRSPLIGFADADTLTFPRHSRWKTANLDWRGYAVTDSATKKERLMNKSTEAIVKIYDSISRILMEDITELFGDEMYIDGNASGNSKRLHGVESALGGGTNTIHITTGVDRSANAADVAGAPSDTYAGLLTDRGNYGGAWTGSWPTGTGDAHYDFWTPVLVNWSSSAWDAAGVTFAITAQKALRYGIIKSQRNRAGRGSYMDLILMESEMYRSFLSLQDTKERLVIEKGSNAKGLTSLGFSDVVNLDGVDVSWEYGVPADTAYGFPINEMSLRSLQAQMFVPEGPDFDIASQSWRFSIDFYGNLTFNPRCMVKWKNYA